MDNIIEQIQLALQQQDQRLVSAISAHSHNIYRQIESFISIQSILKPGLPLPPMRGWAISPDFGALLITEIFSNKPQLIIEMGSGVSTLLSAYCLSAIGGGKLVSLESDEGYAATTTEIIKNHGLDDFVEVIYAPLTNMTLKEETWRWYDISQIDITNSIDMLTVDGPRADIQTNSRYPALAVFNKKLSNNAVIILDDAARQDEQNIVKMWKEENPELRYEYHSCEKGAAILRR